MRMQLTEEEAKIILRMREIEDAHRGGWNKALEHLKEYILEGVDRDENTQIGIGKVCTVIEEMKK